MGLSHAHSGTKASVTTAHANQLVISAPLFNNGRKVTLARLGMERLASSIALHRRFLEHSAVERRFHALREVVRGNPLPTWDAAAYDSANAGRLDELYHTYGAVEREVLHAALVRLSASAS